MSKTMNKAQSERVHFKRRLRERYGIRVNRFGYFHLVDQVKTKRSECLLIQSNTRTVHRVVLPRTYFGTQTPKIPLTDDKLEIMVVYDKLRGELITALPHNLTVDDIEKYTND